MDVDEGVYVLPRAPTLRRTVRRRPLSPPRVRRCCLHHPTPQQQCCPADRCSGELRCLCVKYFLRDARVLSRIMARGEGRGGIGVFKRQQQQQQQQQQSSRGGGDPLTFQHPPPPSPLSPPQQRQQPATQLPKPSHAKGLVGLRRSSRSSRC